MNINEHPHDAALYRLRKALEWAAAEYSSDGWDEYLTGGDVDWTNIVRVPHSQRKS